MDAQSLFRVDTEYSADSVEWCPDPRYKDLFVCGTYQVIAPQPNESSETTRSDDDDEAPVVPVKTKRLGRCLVYNWESRTETMYALYLSILSPLDMSFRSEELQRIDGPAILDMKWYLLT